MCCKELSIRWLFSIDAVCLLALRRNMRAAGNHNEGLVRSVKWLVLFDGFVLFQVSESVGSVRGRAPAVTI